MNKEIKSLACDKANIAYNKVIVDSVISDMYREYGIAEFTGSADERGKVLESQMKTKAELSVELVIAIAIEKAKDDLFGITGRGER